MAGVATGPASEADLGSSRPGRTLARWCVVLAIAVVAFALGYIGLSDFLSHQKTPQFGQGWADIVYYDVQLFVLNSAPGERWPISGRARDRTLPRSRRHRSRDRGSVRPC